MSALALSLAFFVFLAAVGRATLAACRWRGGHLRGWLISPATGLAVMLLAVMALNQADLPVRAFVWPLASILAVASLGLLFWETRRGRLVFPARALLPFAAVIVFSLVWTGWPALRFGFGWLSYVNDDYVNYCLAAERGKDFGFWRVPSIEELAGTDIAQYYWFMHVPGLMRFGSELTLAWVSALTGIKSLHIFMPVIIGLGLIQISSTAALVLHRGRWRRAAFVTAALLALSPLFMLGTLYQLIAQVGGLGLLLAVTAVLTGRLPRTVRGLLPHILVLSILGSAVAVFYPEVTAFAVLTTVIAAGIDAVRTRTFPLARTRLALFGIVGVIVLLRYNVLSYIFTIALQMGQGFRAVDLKLSLFPYFMIPTGLANLLGLMPLSVNFPEPVTSLTIVAGALALLVALVTALRAALRATPIAILLLVQFFLAIRLMQAGNDFGLYKIAMFMQPALAAALAVALLRLPWSRVTVPAALLVAGLCCAPTALHYTRASLGEKAGGITEAKLASALGTRPPSLPPGTRALVDINNLVAAKVAAFELRGTDLRYLSRDYYQQIAPIEFEKLGDTLIGLHPRFDDLMRTRAMLAARDAAVIRDHTVFEGTASATSFRAPALGFNAAGKTDTYLLLDERLGLFNKFRLPPATPSPTYFKALPAADARNHLVFVHTGRGNHYYLGDRERIAIFQPESDLYTKKQDITALGRFMLMRVERPDPEFYLRISATKTFMGDGHTRWSPGAAILGERPVPLGFPGHGAVNRIVGPIRPVYRDGVAYIGLEFDELPFQFRNRRTGLQSLYNTVVPLDSRKLVAYGRDISALSAADVAALDRPSRLARFPDDLLFAKGLEFSGIFEDGWLSPESEFTFAGTPAAGIVRVRGYVPDIPGLALGSGRLLATVGGTTFDLPAAHGAFDWLIPVPAAAPLTRLHLRFTATAKLLDEDNRPVGGKLELIEVLPALPTHTFDFGTAGSARLPATGIDQDGWLGRRVTITLPAGGKRVLRLKLEYPDWSKKPSGHITTAFSVGATVPVGHTLPAAAYTTLDLPVAASAAPQTFTFTADDDFPLPAPDPRRRSARLVVAELQPVP